MKKIALFTILFVTLHVIASAQSNGQGNGGQNSNGNNGNANGNQGNGNGNGNNGNGNGNGGSNGGGESIVAESSGASQSANFALSNAIEITFVNSMSEYGADVTLPFSTVNDYANGVESAEQELKIRSNKNFSVAIKSNAAGFTYSGNTTPAPEMPVNGVLAIKLTANNTGGSIANPFSTSAYSGLTNSNQSLITGGNRGGNQSFAIKYKATPGFAYPAGTYSVDVVYTATQQ